MRIATRCEDYQRYTHVVLDEAETAQTGDIHRVGFSLTAFETEGARARCGRRPPFPGHQVVNAASKVTPAKALSLLLLLRKLL